MKDHEYGNLAVKNIKFSMPEIRKRMEDPRVKELAESRKRFPLHPILVHVDSNILIAGRDRLAADLINGVKRVNCRFVEATEEEARDLEIEENLHRRNDNRDELIARRVKAVASEENHSKGDDELPDNLSGNTASKKVGRPATVGPAREKVARELGTTPEAIRKAEARALAPVKPDPPKPPSQYDLRPIQDAVDAADRAGRAFQAALTNLAIVRFPPGLLQRLQFEARAVTAEIRNNRPHALCALCGGPGCDLCAQAGWQTEAAAKRMTKKNLGSPEAMDTDATGASLGTGSPSPMTIGPAPSEARRESSVATKGTGATATNGATKDPVAAPAPKGPRKLTIVMEPVPQDDDDLPF